MQAGWSAGGRPCRPRILAPARARVPPPAADRSSAPARVASEPPVSRPRSRLPLISSLGAMLRISLRRSRADWPIVVAAGLICLLATTLLAAGSIYASAVSTAGLHRVLADASRPTPNIAVAFRVAPGRCRRRSTRRSAASSRRRWIRPAATILRQARSDSFALPDQPADEVRDLAVLGYARSGSPTTRPCSTAAGRRRAGRRAGTSRSRSASLAATGSMLGSASATGCPSQSRADAALQRPRSWSRPSSGSTIRSAAYWWARAAGRSTASSPASGSRRTGRSSRQPSRPACEGDAVGSSSAGARSRTSSAVAGFATSVASRPASAGSRIGWPAPRRRRRPCRPGCPAILATPTDRCWSAGPASCC